MSHISTSQAATEISIRDLHKSFAELHVLRGINLEIQSGDVIALVGGSGCGKTVLLNHVLGLLVPDLGQVAVADHGLPGAPLYDLAEASMETIDALHSYWGMVFQRNALFSGSVLENIALPLRETKSMTDDQILPIATRVLKAVGLAVDEDFLNRDHSELSGGMAKRLAVARAIATEPLVIFYDEPTTGLDPVSAAQIHDLILTTHEVRNKLGQTRTSVIITHDKDLLCRLRPRTVMLHEGRVLFDGPFDAFEQSDNRIIRPYFEMMPVLHRRDPSA